MAIYKDGCTYNMEHCLIIRMLKTLTYVRFNHVVSRIGKLENFDRTYFLITATDFYHNQVRF